MKFEKLAVELDRKDKCTRLGLWEFFIEKICGYGSCKLCNRIPVCNVEHTDYCPDCLLYVWKVRNNLISKNWFKFKYCFLSSRIDLKETVSDIWETIKEDSFFYVTSIIFICFMILIVTLGLML